MCKLMTVILSIVFLAGVSFADPIHPDDEEKKEEAKAAPKPLKWGELDRDCPFIKVMPPELVKPDDCFRCHDENDFSVKEQRFDTGKYFQCPSDLNPCMLNGKLDGFYFLMWKIDHQSVVDIFAYLDKHPELPKKVTFDMNGPGGHAFNGMKIANTLMSHWDEYEVITMVDGFALSAHFLMLNGGEHRICSRGAELMWHEISYFEWLERVTPSGTADKKEMMDHLQENANAFLAARSGKITADEINERITSNRIGWWLNGETGYEYGFCDELVN
jgi:ATP-dependent protease ClpP protease subunit